MKSAYIIAHHLISALGFTSKKNVEQLMANQSGIRLSDRYSKGLELPLALIDKTAFPFEYKKEYTYLENLMIHSMEESLHQASFDYKSERCLCIISTTKGNIDLLSNEKDLDIPKERAGLGNMAEVIQKYFQFYHVPMVISNACISGSMAVITAQRMIQDDMYDHIIVCGGDIASEFVVAGFNCLKAISHQACKPFDAHRTGISMGEAVATVLMSHEKMPSEKISFEMLGGAISNDANHISGPSRTGEGLTLAIQKTFEMTALNASDIDYVSAHGTATIYNDEMESMAMYRTALDKVPVNSFKGYIGHTLGAAGVIEIVMGIECMRANMLIKSLGYEDNGVEHPLHIIQENATKAQTHLLKLSSGFGGCNAALIIQKQEA